MKKQVKWIWYAVWAVICLEGGGGTLFSWMPRTPAMFYGGCAMLVLAVFSGTMLVLLARGKTPKKSALTGLIAAAVYAAVVAAIVHICDNIIFKDIFSDYQPVHSSLIVVLLNCVLALVMIFLIPKSYDLKIPWLKRIIALVLTAAALVLSGLPQNWWWGRYNYKIASMKRVAAPTGYSTYTEPETVLITDADFYVAADGDDGNDGSISAPFATIERARDAVRNLDKTGRISITVAVKAGEYRVGSLMFNEEDSGTEDCLITYCAYGDGEVILNAGVTLNAADFTPVTGSQAERLSAAARDQVVCVDLGKYGITAKDYGALHAIGRYNTASKYDGDYTGDSNCELFVNDTRQTIARYPNEGWLYTYELVDEGEPRETLEEPHYVQPYWETIRNPQGETYRIEADLAEHINGWATLDDVWMYGYFTADWAPSSSPIEEFSYENLTIHNKFVAMFGPRSGGNHAPYYFYNVFEELDAPGEWYLDRDAGLLYLYKSDGFDNASIMLSLSTEPIFTLEQADWLTLSGFTLEGTRGDGIVINGNNDTVEYCLIKNIAGTGVTADGYGILISSNEITRTGQGAVYITGGDTETLTPSGNRVYNNLIHDWGEVDGRKGIICYGVGALVDHNELYHYIDDGIEYRGNNHILEYNVIHDIDLETSDGGAFYNGRSWTDYGCVVRYNLIYNMGTPGYSTPNGIYLDDGLAGQQIYGNLIVNVPQNGIKLGGGRDNEVWGNVVINTSENGIYGIGAVLYGSMPNDVWDSLLPGWLSSYKDTEIWQKAYPALAATFWTEEAVSDDPNFIANAANNHVNGNVVVNMAGELGKIEGDQNKFSDFSGNAVFTLDQLKKIFTDPDKGDYSLRADSLVYEIIPGFATIPIERIGRE